MLMPKDMKIVNYDHQIWNTECYFFAMEHLLDHGFDWYCRMFASGEGYKVIAEKTPYYACPEFPPHGRTSLWWIHHYLPHVKLIITIRNPAERAFSDWLFRIRMPIEKPLWWKNTFQETVADLNCGCVTHGIYVRGIQEAFGLFGRENVLVLVMERVKANLRQEYDRVCRFLDIDPAGFQQPLGHFNTNDITKKIDSVSRERLSKFYDHHNLQLKRLLGDELPEWK